MQTLQEFLKELEEVLSQSTIVDLRIIKIDGDPPAYGYVVNTRKVLDKTSNVLMDFNPLIHHGNVNTEQ